MTGKEMILSVVAQWIDEGFAMNSECIPNGENSPAILRLEILAPTLPLSAEAVDDLLSEAFSIVSGDGV